jgi:plastocyanin
MIFTEMLPKKPRRSVLSVLSVATLFSVLSVAALALGVAACKGADAPPPAPAANPNAKRVDESKAGNVSGKITYEGPAPENRVVKAASDPACAREHPNGLSLDTILVNNGALENVFVYVKDGLGDYAFDTPAQAVVLDQKGCRYTPHIFGVRVGQAVEIVNSDPTMHNVHALAQANREFNFPQAVQGMKQPKTFSAPEVMVHFKCDVHNWMSAYVGVVAHPYFAVSTNGGTFELKNLPAGTYTIEAWHEKLGTQTQSVTIGEKETKAITFAFKAGTT